jgi:hypothetical protein
LALLILTVLFLLPFGVWALLWRRQATLAQEESKTRFGSTYMELRLNSRTALLYNVIYMLRRQLFAFTAIFLKSWPFAQVQVVIFHSVCVMMYLILFRPFEEPSMNRLEVFNEGCILAASFHLIAFTELTGDPDIQYKGGWSIIGVTSLNIVINMLFMIVATVQKVRITMRKIEPKLRQILNQYCLKKKSAQKYH